MAINIAFRREKRENGKVINVLLQHLRYDPYNCYAAFNAAVTTVLKNRERKKNYEKNYFEPRQYYIVNLEAPKIDMLCCCEHGGEICKDRDGATPPPEKHENNWYKTFLAARYTHYYTFDAEVVTVESDWGKKKEMGKKVQPNVFCAR